MSLCKPPSATALTLLSAIRSRRFIWKNEKELQDGIGRVLEEAGIAFEREFRLGDAGVIDFMCGRIGVEIKVKGSPSEVAAQLVRYAKKDAIDELILITAAARLGVLPAEIHGKPVRVIALWRSSL